MRRAWLLLVLAVPGCRQPGPVAEVVPGDNQLVEPAPDSDGVLRARSCSSGKSGRG